MVISASLQACGVVFPFAMLTSICRSIVTICSGLYRLIGMTRFSSKWILSHSTWYKSCRSRHINPPDGGCPKPIPPYITPKLPDPPKRTDVDSATGKHLYKDEEAYQNAHDHW